MTSQRKTKGARHIRSLELFTGAGGLAVGTHLAGFRHAALLEWNRDACDTLRANARHRALPGISRWRVIEQDIRHVRHAEFGPIDLVAGGPPCQPFSIGGKHRAHRDDRDMIPEYIRAVRETKPRAFIFENVRGLARPGFRNYYAYVQLQLTHPTVTRKRGERWESHLRRLEDVHTADADRDLRYNIVSRVLNAADYGVPQSRERVFIVGFRADLGVDWHFPEPTHSLDRLLYEQWSTGEYWNRVRLRPPATLRARWDRRARALSSLAPPPAAPWVTLREALAGLPEPDADRDAEGVSNHRLQPGARAYPGHTGSPLDMPSKALKAGVHGVPGGENMIAFEDGRVRYLTVREAARVQTFPDRWSLCGAWSEAMRQLGNAVPTALARVVATSVAGRLKAANA